MSDKVKQQYIDWLSEVCNARVLNTKLIQPLWSGYGACFRATLDFSSDDTAKDSKIASANSADKGQQEKENTTFLLKTNRHKVTKVVVKCATPPNSLSHPKGWNGKASHNRKCQSFAVENSFYSRVQRQTDAYCPTAKYIAHSQQGEASLLVMEDLAHTGFSRTASSLTPKQCETVLKWLAYFHARFLNVRSEIENRNLQLWSVGTYWHLATRGDEFQAMTEGLLKQNAVAIAKTLASANYQTLVHGDAKVANFCFNEDFSACAAVDFQYVGFGVGIKDVAYFLGSALPTETHIAHREALLDFYFLALEAALQARFSNHDAPPYFTSSDIEPVIAEWKKLYPFACADFYRFLSGWSPKHWKLDAELEYQTNIALAALTQND